MQQEETERLVQQLTAGFEALQDAYQKLFGQHQSLERKLATAREHYNELAKLCGSGALSTPPLSLSSLPNPQTRDATTTPAVADLLDQRPDVGSTDAARKVRAAVNAAQTLRKAPYKPTSTTAEGVKIWAGPAADGPEPASSMMPSISESPLEQDFTIEGVPSKLGCPFASMANKKLSSHAASVLSRYNSRDSAAGPPSTLISSVSRVNGRESMARRGSRKASFADPIKAEICGLSDHQVDDEALHSEQAAKHHEPDQQDNADVGVCPIRFIDQHSPEEIATYFEKHKHELPRSHEICVRRYQSNEEQIRQLDAKYGNLVSMIQGLGARHKDMLPEDPAETAADPKPAGEDREGTEKVRKWASSITAGDTGNALTSETADEDRLPHFERPLRDIRLGESPSRPWGITVPARYLEEARSETSSKPAQVASSPPPLQTHRAGDAKQEERKPPAQAARCPFGFDKAQDQSTPPPHEPSMGGGQQRTAPAKEAPAYVVASEPATSGEAVQKQRQQQMVFTGPVFIGYSAEDAAKILRDSGLGKEGR